MSDLKKHILIIEDVIYMVEGEIARHGFSSYKTQPEQKVTQ
tara:strand:+ start:1194 stop:1316 length:123 start_codon:yes stop_codon:yes gene_type:complete